MKAKKPRRIGDDGQLCLHLDNEGYLDDALHEAGSLERRIRKAQQTISPTAPLIIDSNPYDDIEALRASVQALKRERKRLLCAFGVPCVKAIVSKFQALQTENRMLLAELTDKKAELSVRDTEKDELLRLKAENAQAKRILTENRALREENEALKATTKSMNEENSGLMRDLTEYRKRWRDEKTRNEAHEAKIPECEEALRNRDKKIEQCETVIEDLKALNKELDSENALLRLKVASQEKEIKDITEREERIISELKKEKKQALSEMEKQRELMIKASGCEKERAVADVQKMATEKVSKLKRARRRELEKVECQKQEEIARIKKDFECELEQVKKEKDEKIAKLIEEKNTEISRLTQEMQLLVQEKDAKITHFSEMVANLTKQKEEAIDKISKEKKRALAKRRQRSECVIAELKQETEEVVSRLTHEHELAVLKLKQEKEQAISLLTQEKSQEVARLRQEVESIQARIKSEMNVEMEAKKRTFDEQIFQIQQKEQEKVVELKQTTEDLNEQRRECLRLSSDVTSLTKTLNEKEKVISWLNEEKHELSQTIAQLKTENQAMTKQIERNAFELEALKRPQTPRMIRNTDDDPEFLSQQIVMLKKKLSELSDQLQNAKQEIADLNSGKSTDEDLTIEQNRRKSLANLLAKTVRMLTQKTDDFIADSESAMKSIDAQLEFLRAKLQALHLHGGQTFVLDQCQVLVDAIWDQFGNGDAPSLSRFVRFPTEFKKMIDNVVAMQQWGIKHLINEIEQEIRDFT